MLFDEHFKDEHFRIEYDVNAKGVKPFDEDIIIDFKPSLPNSITIATPLIPTKFYSEKELEWITKNNPALIQSILKRWKLDNDSVLIPKEFGYPSDKRYSSLSDRPRYEYRCMNEGRKIYHPTFKPTLKNFKQIMKVFKECTFTTAFYEAFENKIAEKIEIVEAKKMIGIFSKDVSLIPSQSKLWSKEIPPFKHQKLMLEYGSRLPYFPNLSEMGTGKTYPTIITIAERFKKGQIEKAFVVVPKTISRTVWKKQIEKYSKLKVQVVDAPVMKRRMEQINSKAQIFIVGYEMLAVMIETILPLLDNKVMVILDESSKIKNPTAKRSKALHTVGRMVKYKIILNGTPITQGAQDIFSQFLFLDCGETFGSSYEQFLNEYFFKEPYKWTWTIKGPEALEDISDKIYHCGLRYLKKECLDLPPKLYETREITLTKEQWDSYVNMRDMLVAWIETKEKKKERIDASVVVTKLLRLSQITSGFSKNDVGQVVEFPINPKLNELSSFIDDTLYNGNQLVVWARFIPDLMAIKKLCDSKNISSGLLYGKINNNDREQLVNNFLNKKIKIFIGQQGAGGLGIDLFTANQVIYYSNDYTLLNRLQSEDRTHRKGSEEHNKVCYYDLVATGPNGEGTIDHHILNTVLKEKKNVADIVTRDGIRSILGLEATQIASKAYSDIR
jgi:SNF2 family DNA or RNA helicase